MMFSDEPVPGYPLPVLPGHTSPGRLERVLRAGPRYTKELLFLMVMWMPSMPLMAVERIVIWVHWLSVHY